MSVQRCVCKRGQIHTRVTPERTSSREIRLCPSLRSSYKSEMCFLTWERRTGRKRDRKLISLSNHPSVDSLLLTCARPIAPQLTGLVTAVAGPTETKCQLWPLRLCCHDIASDEQGWGWVSYWWRLLPIQWLSSLAEPCDRHQCLFCFETGTQSVRRTGGRTETDSAWTERGNNGSAELWRVSKVLRELNWDRKWRHKY